MRENTTNHRILHCGVFCSFQILIQSFVKIISEEGNRSERTLYVLTVRNINNSVDKVKAGQEAMDPALRSRNCSTSAFLPPLSFHFLKCWSSLWQRWVVCFRLRLQMSAAALQVCKSWKAAKRRRIDRLHGSYSLQEFEIPAEIAPWLFRGASSSDDPLKSESDGDNRRARNAKSQADIERCRDICDGLRFREWIRILKALWYETERSLKRFEPIGLWLIHVEYPAILCSRQTIAVRTKKPLFVCSL